MTDHNNINEAMLAFAAEFGGAHKTGVNPHFKSSYMTLDDIVRETNPVLTKHGMYVTHGMDEGNIKTEVIHAESETSNMSRITLPVIADPQKIGSAITYYKRYNLCALLNIAEADDDGNAAVAATTDRATKDQLAIIQDYREAGCVSDEMDKWLKKRGSYLTAVDADQVITNIKAKS